MGAGGAPPREPQGWMLAGRFTPHLGPAKVQKALEARVGPARWGDSRGVRLVSHTYCANWYLGPSGQEPALSS